MNHHSRNPESPDTYQTGSTCPPRSHSGLFAILLIGGILCVNLVRAGGLYQLLQWQLFQDPSSSLSQFADLSDTGRVTQTPPAVDYGELSLELADTPAVPDHILQPGGLPLQDIYEKNISSVVSVTVTCGDGTRSGTGVVLSSQGYIVTNCHVLAGAESVEVLLTSGETLGAAIVGTDTLTDLGVLYVKHGQLQAAEFGDSSGLQVGDAVAAIGDPLETELRGTMTDGIVSAVDRQFTVDGRAMNLIQTNAALNTGNSGGPLLNSYGQVIGINTLKLSGTDGAEGLGFAIPSTTVKAVVEQLIRQGYVPGRPTLGISGETVAPFYQISFHYPAGLYITQVETGSSAAAKGVSCGDILLSLDGTRILSEEQLAEFLCGLQPGQTVRARVYRSGRQRTVELTVGELQ